MSLDTSNTAPYNLVAAIAQVGLGTYLTCVMSPTVLSPKLMPTKHAALADEYNVLNESSITLGAKFESPKGVPLIYPFSVKL